MTDRIKAYFYAAASVMDIMPSTNYAELISTNSDVDAIRQDVYRIGEDMRAIAKHEFESGEGEKRQSSQNNAAY